MSGSRAGGPARSLRGRGLRGARAPKDEEGAGAARRPKRPPARRRARGAAHRPLQIALGVASLGAILILLRLFGDLGALVGVLAIIAGTVLSAPYAPSRPEPGRGWWTLLAVGALLTLLGVPLTLLLRTPGGLLAVGGCVLVAVAVALGFPFSDPEGRG